PAGGGDDLEARELEHVPEVAGRHPVSNGLVRLQAKELCKPDQGPPELAVRMHDQTATLVRHPSDLPRQRLKVERIRNEVGEDDVVELLVTHELLAGGDLEFEPVVTGTR